MSELKPCPFCGVEVQDDERGEKYPRKSPMGGWIIHCECCGASLSQFRKSGKGEISWNTRPIEDALQARIAELEEENNRLLEADYVISNREMLIMQTELGRLKSELARRDEELKTTDGLLKEATEAIGAVVACCTYNSNDDAKIGIYGIDQKAFTRIDRFITHYNDAVSAGKVSVDVKPVQRPADPSLEEDEFDSMPIEKINQYLREHGYDPEKVGLRGKILVEALTKNIIAREIIQRFLNKEGGCRFCEYDKYLPLDAPKNGHEESCLYLAARAYLDNETSTVVKRDLSDAEIEELGAQEAERKEFCPNCEAETPCTHEAELFVCDICGEDFAKYIVSRNCNVSDVSMTQGVLTGVKTPESIENPWIPVSENPAKSDWYLITYRGYRVPDAGYYDVEAGWLSDIPIPDYWMPLPNPPEVK